MSDLEKCKEQSRERQRRFRERHPDYKNNGSYRASYAQRHQEHIEQRKAYYRDNPNMERNARLKRKYNISQDDYDKLHEAQGGRCAICGKKKRLVVDHDHDTGEVRGLLCGNCNTGIGMLGDTPGDLKNALEYLEKNDSTKIR